MATEMRCEHKLHGVVDDEFIEVKCGSSLCGSGPGVVVIHKFDKSGDLVETMKFKDTPMIRKEANGHRTAIRTP